MFNSRMFMREVFILQFDRSFISTIFVTMITDLINSMWTQIWYRIPRVVVIIHNKSHEGEKLQRLYFKISIQCYKYEMSNCLGKYTSRSTGKAGNSFCLKFWLARYRAARRRVFKANVANSPRQLRITFRCNPPRGCTRANATARTRHGGFRPNWKSFPS